MIQLRSPAKRSHFRVIKNLLLIGLAVIMNSPFIGECGLWVLIKSGFVHAALEGVWITRTGAVGKLRFLLVISNISLYQWFTYQSYSPSGVGRL